MTDGAIQEILEKSIDDLPADLRSRFVASVLTFGSVYQLGDSRSERITNAVLERLFRRS
ncbi:MULTISPECIES: hypothetical protein [unclassified Mesorhizobium]|uniref:hypothetical protein n=1 Tax=unclassified Mesorhizobium TaxID=325217 RepID=UPI0015E332BA|nr:MULTISPECIES: hypothetical protein [unclassified Mesorhizobium]MBZ9894562.1 hypothetical protein [Mesorhizobium sp. BR1-1-6]